MHLRLDLGHAGWLAFEVADHIAHKTEHAAVFLPFAADFFFECPTITILLLSFFCRYYLTQE